MNRDDIEITVRMNKWDLDAIVEMALKEWPALESMRSEKIGLAALYLPFLARQKIKAKRDRIEAQREKLANEARRKRAEQEKAYLEGAAQNE